MDEKNLSAHLTEKQKQIDVLGNLISSTAMSLAVDAQRMREDFQVSLETLKKMRTRVEAISGRLDQMRGLVS